MIASMKVSVDLIVVIPLGPNCQLSFIADTISSVRHYVHCDHRILLADDSQKGTGRELQKLFPWIETIETERPMGKLCGLYLTLSMAFRHVLDRYHFKALLRMDTDALIIGRNPERAAFELFRREPDAGMAGQYPLDYDGRPWDISWPRTQLVKYLHSYKFFKHPIAHYKLLKLFIKARKNGYRTGESVFGGACFFSEPCLRRLLSMGLLPDQTFHVVNLEEDHLFSLLVSAAGFKLAGLSGNGLPVACSWIGLPASPEELHERGKKVIHSTRRWKDMSEEEIRKTFRAQRTAAAIETN